ncbi:MAG: hypothetical protein AAGF47_13005, partial [Planctomycetota bacterium]
MTRSRRLAAIGLVLLSVASRADAFTFNFQDQAAFGPDSVSYAPGYGVGAIGDTFFTDPDFTVTVTVGIASDSMVAQEMIAPTANVVDTWNRQVPTTGNLDNNVVAFNAMDFESVLLPRWAMRWASVTAISRASRA